MEQELKARKLGSANVRKQRIAERQVQKTVLAEQREERKKRFMRYSEIYSTDSSRSSSPDQSAATPSDIDIRTPQNSSPETELLKIQSSEFNTYQVVVDHDASNATLLAKRLSKTKPPPMFTASLNTANDWKYDRFSVYIKEKEETDSSSESEDELSPIEVATPISYHAPTTRPAVVAVTISAIPRTRGPAKFSVSNISDIMIRPQTSSSRHTGSIASLKENNKSGFLASEAKPFEITPEQEKSIAEVKKKSGVPMLNRFAHARMSSIKSFIKPQSISGPPAIPQIPKAHQSRASESVNDLLFRPSTAQDITPRRSFTEPPQSRMQIPEQRPQTARLSKMNISSIAHSNVTNPMPRPPSTIDLLDEPSLNKKKSFTNLRRRSGSLGQALKFATSGKKPATPDAPMPPLPMIQVPSQESLSNRSSLMQPPKSPRSVRKSGMYSPFPSTNSSRSQPVGLGLRI